MEDKIAGHKIPKYNVPEEDLDILLFNMENAKASQATIDREKANETRALAGVCRSCRLRSCLCHEGQS